MVIKVRFVLNKYVRKDGVENKIKEALEVVKCKLQNFTVFEDDAISKRICEIAIDMSYKYTFVIFLANAYALLGEDIEAHATKYSCQLKPLSQNDDIMLKKYYNHMSEIYKISKDKYSAALCLVDDDPSAVNILCDEGAICKRTESILFNIRWIAGFR